MCAKLYFASLVPPSLPPSPPPPHTHPQHGSPVNVHYWPFMLPGAKGQLAEVYTAVSDLMSDVVEATTTNPRATLIHTLQTICRLVVDP